MEYRVPDALTASDVKNLVYRLTHPRSANPDRCLSRQSRAGDNAPSTHGVSSRLSHRSCDGYKPGRGMKATDVKAITERLLRPTVSSALHRSATPDPRGRRMGNVLAAAGFIRDDYGRKGVTGSFKNGYYHQHHHIDTGSSYPSYTPDHSRPGSHRVVYYGDSGSRTGTPCCPRIACSSNYSYPSSSRVSTASSRARSPNRSRSSVSYSSTGSGHSAGSLQRQVGGYRISRPPSRADVSAHDIGPFLLHAGYDRNPALLFITNSQYQDYGSHTVASSAKKRPSVMLFNNTTTMR